MRKTALIASFVALAAPASAFAAEPYVAISGGVALPGDSMNEGAFDVTVPATPDWGAIPADTSLEWKTEFDTGYAISGQIGMRYSNGLRTELDLSYTSADVDTHSGLAAGGAVIDGVDVAVLTRGAPGAANPTVGAVIADGQGRVKTLGAFVNGFYDFNVGGGISPFVGAGIGYQQVDVVFRPSGVLVADDKDSGFAWQLMAGANVSVSESAEIFLQYTYRESFDRADIELTLLPATLGVESGGSALAAGVRFSL
ncbi:Surface antigen [Croceibacterium atlanticum]|uniref:Surface antigen n=1 Tax=Croceibacterium atlanticum TaxID=1267766 RepID=A0A0F7KWS6_9SPHN|nr:outer membrane beta-barrel protein [Croceibacterium atlanticum]AKH43255.1 Surface antigen [Croceibacterium atlanticum]